MGTEPGFEEHAPSAADPADWFLQYLAVLVDDTQELSLGITLQAGGLLVSGQLVSEKSYFEAIADDIAATSILDSDDRTKVREIFATLGNGDHQEPGDRIAPHQFIHLRNARFFNKSGDPLSATSGFLWRGRISEVKGFSMGTLFQSGTATPDRQLEQAGTSAVFAADSPMGNLDILEFTQDAIFVWEMHGEGILYWNRAAEHLYGYSRNEAVGHTSHVLLKTKVEGGMHAVEEQLTRFGVWAGTLQHTGRNARVVPVQARLSLLSQRNGRLLVIEVNRGAAGAGEGRVVGTGASRAVDEG